MLPERLGPDDLLEYIPDYHVLVCRKCQYAIQKSALQSHLLRHKIYRDEKQRLLACIAQLDLYEPEDVPLPVSTSPPLDALPRISGYCCTAVECGSLCSSFKRMKRHRSEVHGINEPCELASFARPVTLQTFFRGTKLKYFEVTPSPTVRAEESASSANLHEHHEHTSAAFDRVEYVEDSNDAGVAETLTPQHLLTPSEATGHSLTVPDLETLTYFHHFMNKTSYTLPNYKSEPIYHWHTDVVILALQCQWLMCGLLAVSAGHLAVLSERESTKQIHQLRMAQYFSEFLKGWAKFENGGLRMNVAIDGEKARKIGRQVERVIRCVNWPSTRDMLDDAIIPSPITGTNIHGILAIIKSIRNSACHSIALRTDDLNGKEETFVQATRILHISNSLEASNSDAFSPGENTLSALLSRLDALPSRMTEAFGRPNSTRDVLATLEAIASLVDCCASSFATEEVETAWWAMATWLTQISTHFSQMISHNNPAALVVLVHWAVSLVRRAESRGCWFLNGVADTMLHQIVQQISIEDPAIYHVIEDLIA